MLNPNIVVFYDMLTPSLTLSGLEVEFLGLSKPMQNYPHSETVYGETIHLYTYNQIHIINCYHAKVSVPKIYVGS